MSKTRLVLIGFGTIGRSIAKTIAELDSATITGIVTRQPVEAGLMPHGARRYASVAESLAQADLVVEAAGPAVIAEVGETILEGASLMPFSLTALSDDALRDRMLHLATRSGTTLFVPHGAVLGLDGLSDGRDLIDSVQVSTVKHPRNLGLEEERDAVLFEGPARRACALFPRNVNVHAAVSLAGIGFDRTLSRIVADPTTTTMRHDISVRGDGIDWSLSIASQATSGVSGSYTPVSAAASVATAVRRLDGSAGLSFA